MVLKAGISIELGSILFAYCKVLQAKSMVNFFIEIPYEDGLRRHARCL